MARHFVGLLGLWACLAAACDGESSLLGKSNSKGDASASNGGSGAGGESGGSNAGGDPGAAGGKVLPGTGGGLGAAAATGGGGAGCDPSLCIPIACDPGEVAVLVPGACCRQRCVPGGALTDGSVPTGTGGAPPVLIDAGTCKDAPMPSCPSNNWPYCTDDWATAMSFYPTCPNPDIGAYLATCSGVDAIVVPGPFETRTFLFDHFGRLAGFESFGQGKARCEAYRPGFTAPLEACQPIGHPCYDAGPPPVPTLGGDLDAGAFITWGDGVPDCKTGQAAYDAYLASQLAQYNRCAGDEFCFDTHGLAEHLQNRCAQPCDLFLTAAAINSQISSRLDSFGNYVCARCDLGPPACPPPGLARGSCVNGRCVFPAN
jgi:hypothetical protein